MTTRDWRDDTECQYIGIELFYPFSNTPGGKESADYALAKRICNQCPVSVECLEQAMTEEYGCGSYRYGFRGRMTPHQRYKLALSRGEVTGAVA